MRSELLTYFSFEPSTRVIVFPGAIVTAQAFSASLLPSDVVRFQFIQADGAVMSPLEVFNSSRDVSLSEAVLILH